MMNLKSLVKRAIPASWIVRWYPRVSWLAHRALFSPTSFLYFTCNICGRRNSFHKESMMRETRSCLRCGSSVRSRSVIHSLSVELFGESLSIEQFPATKSVVGVGLSDWDGYARRLAEKFTYANTYYHQEPFLDIANVDPDLQDIYDFIIATDVFEHVSQPISPAFTNACRLLKPGGVLILSVPYVAGETTEHFPELWKFSVTKENGTWTLTNETRSGKQERYTNLTFHGGPGSVVEMRLFGKDSLEREFTKAGFGVHRLHDETVERFGIIWNQYDAEKAPYRPLIYGLDTAPWALIKNA